MTRCKVSIMTKTRRDDQQPIYLDYNATTPLHPDVAQAMIPFLTDSNLFGNPSSSHVYGMKARTAVETARKQVAELLSCFSDEITFTSCGSESNNFAIKGLVHKYPERNHIVTSKTEHVAVIEVCKYLEQNHGTAVTYLNVNSDGIVDLEELRESLNEKTLLVTIMHANNETGTLQPIVEIGEILTQFQQRTGNYIFFHTDASQSVGKVAFKLYSTVPSSSVVQFGPLSVNDFSRVDLLTICPHKFYGPKGVAALFIRRSTSQGKLLKQIHGANHEQNLRAGTENVLEIVGLGKACSVAAVELYDRIVHMKTLRDLLYQRLVDLIGDENLIHINGPRDTLKRLPNTLNISFLGIQSNTLLDEVSYRIAASAGAACHSGDEYVASYVLQSMGIPLDIALGSIRLSTGRLLTENDIEEAAQIISDAVKRLMPQIDRDEQSEVCEIDSRQSVRLTSMTHGLGCGCKIRPQALEKILQSIPKTFDPNVLVGTETSDDAGVYKLSSDLAMVTTVDFFTPMVDNARDFGAIACSNALSDIYAMGGKAITALNIVGFPVRRLPLSILQEILLGAQLKCQEAGVSVVGGHSIEDNEMFFGQSVTGIIHPDKIWRNIGAKAGDVLMLSKSIGVGLVTTAMKRNMIGPDSLIAQKAIASMSLLNKYVADRLQSQNFRVTACTDVTGFGLLGHLKEMIQSDETITAVVNASQVPIIEGVTDLATIPNLIPGGTLNNMQFVQEVVNYSSDLPEVMKIVLCDAQTSGGLLFTVPESEAATLLEDLNQQGIFIRQIGSIQKRVNNQQKQIHVLN